MIALWIVSIWLALTTQTLPSKPANHTGGDRPYNHPQLATDNTPVADLLDELRDELNTQPRQRI